MAFMHLRSCAGMARHIRRLAKGVRKIIPHLQEYEEKRKQAEELGSIPAVVAADEHILGYYDLEEKDLEKIEEEEEILLFEETKLDQQEEKKLSAAAQHLQLPDDVEKELEAGVIKALKQAAKAIHHVASMVRKEERDMYRDRERWVKYAAAFSDEWISKTIRRLANKQITMIHKETRDEEQLDQLLKELAEEAKKKDIPAEHATVKQINDLGKKLGAALIKEAKEMWTIMHDAHIIQIHLLHKINRLEPQEIQKLADEGFDQQKLNLKKEGLTRILSNNHAHMRRLYHMSDVERRKSG